MKFILFFIFLAFPNEAIIKDAVYNLIYNNSYFNYDNKHLKVSETLKEEIHANFRIRKSYEENDTIFYNIENVFSDLSLFLSPIDKHNLVFTVNLGNNNFGDWNFIQFNENEYKIQNKNQCFIKIDPLLNITCENVTSENASSFHLIKIYEEVRHTQSDIELIEKEPIDIVIKYIDLNDSNITFKGLPDRIPDYDDEELKYCVRSIIKNAPWVRKIFILMPNENIKYFKDYDLIKDKIIYVKDIDIYGSNNYNWNAFKFRYWKMKKFGITDNFIAMDYNNFFGMPLSKTDFFYIKKGKITPAIVTPKFVELKNFTSHEIKSDLKKYAFRTSPKQTSNVFKESLYETYLFILKLFKKATFAPAHNFNAIPLNIKELEEIYNVIYNSDYKFNTLYSYYKNEKAIQFQVFVFSYGFLKHHKKVINLPTKLCNNKNPTLSHYNYSLFSFILEENTCEYITFMKQKIILEYLFQDPTPYEKPIINNTFHILAYNAVYTIDSEFRLYKDEKKNITRKLKEEIHFYKIQIELFHCCICLTTIIFFVYWKILIQKKEREKLKGYEPFNKKEIY